MLEERAAFGEGVQTTDAEQARHVQNLEVEEVGPEPLDAMVGDVLAAVDVEAAQLGAALHDDAHALVVDVLVVPAKVELFQVGAACGNVGNAHVGDGRIAELQHLQRWRSVACSQGLQRTVVDLLHSVELHRHEASVGVEDLCHC